jgi:phosphoribosylcarboxyaminoimidazole (NCAIR) mutase
MVMSTFETLIHLCRAVAVLVGSDQDWAALKAAMDVGKTGVVGLKGP